MQDSRIQQDAYDAILYPDDPHFWSEPARFAAAATLYGLSPTPIEEARVLEVGCASGGNIIPMAARYPRASFYGFDISGKQIEAAQRHLDETGLTNITFERADICELPSDIGTFDYIIGHGVCSWVPPTVRIALWTACRTLLRPNGLIYFSYNTLPGWHFKRAVRDLLNFRMLGKEQHESDLRDAVSFFSRVQSHASGIYRHLLDLEKQFVDENSVNYIRHEYLEEENNAFYVRDFLLEAQAYDFTYVCEADPTASNVALLPSPVRDAIVNDSQGERIIQEQYIDFHINRSFRRSIFARRNDAQAVGNTVLPECIDNLFIVPVDLPATVIHGDQEETMLAFPATFFSESTDSEQVQAQQLALKAIQELRATLDSSHSTIAVADFMRQLQQDLPDALRSCDVLRLSIVELFYRKCFALATHASAWSDDVERPKLQDLVRSDAMNGRASSTNVLHERVAFTSDRSRLFMSLLDGNRTRDDLTRELLMLPVERGFSTDQDIAEYIEMMLTKIRDLKLLD